MKTIQASDFLELAKESSVIDVRSPAEFKKGHIPGATNLPLFEDNERAIIGTLYKNQGKTEAIQKGLELVAPKMTAFTDQALALARNRKILVHCWRGGMRSNSVAWLFETLDLEVLVLDGGYKGYRQHIREEIIKNHNLLVLGGLTGTGKTQLLQGLEKAGEPIIDLERLANHRGSVFGGAGQAPQPSGEQFENDLFEQIANQPTGIFLWVEDESKRIGALYQPEPFYQKLRSATLVFVELSDEERQNILVQEYSTLPIQELKEAIIRISKRLGGLVTQQALLALEDGAYQKVASMLLPYYDKLYMKGLTERAPASIVKMNLSGLDWEEKLDRLITLRKSLA